MDTNVVSQSAYFIKDKKKIIQISALLNQVSADGSTWEDFAKNTPITKVYILGENQKYYKLTLYGQSIRSLMSKNGSFDLGNGEDKLVKLLLEKSANK